jgi:hypothetical protein
MAGSARRSGWGAAVLWALWAAVTTLLVFEFPTAAVVLGLTGLGLAKLLRAWPEGAAGTLAGSGATCLLIGLLNLGGGRPCPSSQASCGGVAPVPLLIVGGLLIAAAGFLYSATIRHASR